MSHRTIAARARALVLSSLLALIGVPAAHAAGGAAAGASARALPTTPAAAAAMTGAYDLAVQALIAGDEPTAEAAYREAIAHADRGAIRDARYALSCVELAMLRARVGDVDEAVILMAKAHAARRALLGVEHPDVIETRLMLRQLERERTRDGDPALLQLTAR